LIITAFYVKYVAVVRRESVIRGHGRLPVCESVFNVCISGL